MDWEFGLCFVRFLTAGGILDLRGLKMAERWDDCQVLVTLLDPFEASFDGFWLDLLSDTSTM